MEVPFWYKMLHKWCTSRTGMTLPYIVGAISVESETDVSKDDIESFINEAVESNLPQQVVAIRCDNVRDLVFGLTDKRHKYSTGIYLSNNFYITTSIAQFATTQKELVNYCMKYWDDIKEGKFSKVRGQYIKFDKSDYDFINESKAIIIDP